MGQFLALMARAKEILALISEIMAVWETLKPIIEWFQKGGEKPKMNEDEVSSLMDKGLGLIAKAQSLDVVQSKLLVSLEGETIFGASVTRNDDLYKIVAFFITIIEDIFGAGAGVVMLKSLSADVLTGVNSQKGNLPAEEMERLFSVLASIVNDGSRSKEQYADLAKYMLGLANMLKEKAEDKSLYLDIRACRSAAYSVKELFTSDDTISMPAAVEEWWASQVESLAPTIDVIKKTGSACDFKTRTNTLVSPPNIEREWPYFVNTFIREL